MAMSKNCLNLVIDEPLWEDALPAVEEVAAAVLETALDFVKQNEEIAFLKLGKIVSINLSLSNDAEVQKLNAEFRRLDKPTNVLSFANIDDEEFEDSLAEAEVIELGDIIIALETMQRESAAKNISLHDHFCHLLAHGVLHLLGFDHQEDDEAEYMEDFEVKILRQMNINNPYEE